MKVIVAGSGKNLVNINNWNTEDITVVGVNNVWKGTSKWNYLIHAGDYPYKKDIKPNNNQTVLSFNTKMSYKDSYAGMAKMSYAKAKFFLGLPIYFTVTYWALWYLKPTHIGCIGVDMNYTPDKDGSTAFYGVGYDMKTRGVPDPLWQFRNVPEYQKMDDPYSTLMNRLQERTGKCKIVNLSTDETSMLPWERVSFDQFKSM